MIKLFKKRGSNEQFETEIDLHIESLAPHMIDALPERIRDFQIEKCRAFIEQCIQEKLPVVLIIHGKGKGVLRQEVIHLIKSFQEVRFFLEKHDGGALEVWLG